MAKPLGQNVSAGKAIKHGHVHGAEPKTYLKLQSSPEGRQSFSNFNKVTKHRHRLLFLFVERHLCFHCK